MWHKTVSSLLLFTYWFVYHFSDLWQERCCFEIVCFSLALSCGHLNPELSHLFSGEKYHHHSRNYCTVQYSGLLYSRELLKLTTFPLNFHLHYSTCSKWLQDQLVLDQGWYLPSFQLKFSRILSVYSRTLLTLHHWSGMDIAWLKDCREVRNRNGAREAILVTQW